jgi:hypothetical protein
MAVEIPPRAKSSHASHRKRFVVVEKKVDPIKVDPIDVVDPDHSLLWKRRRSKGVSVTGVK